MANITFANGFTADQFVALFQTMKENGVTTTDAIGEGPDTITLADTHTGTDTFGGHDHFRSIENIMGSENDDHLSWRPQSQCDRRQ